MLRRKDRIIARLTSCIFALGLSCATAVSAEAAPTCKVQIDALNAWNKEFLRLLDAQKLPPLQRDAIYRPYNNRRVAVWNELTHIKDPKKCVETVQNWCTELRRDYTSYTSCKYPPD